MLSLWRTNPLPGGFQCLEAAGTKKEFAPGDLASKTSESVKSKPSAACPRELNGMVRVRRERRLVHSGCKSHPGTGSFHPVAIGAAVEVTKLLKPPMKEGLEDDSAIIGYLFRHRTISWCPNNINNWPFCIIELSSQILDWSTWLLR